MSNLSDSFLLGAISTGINSTFAKSIGTLHKSVLIFLSFCGEQVTTCWNVLGLARLLASTAIGEKWRRIDCYRYYMMLSSNKKMWGLKRFSWREVDSMRHRKWVCSDSDRLCLSSCPALWPLGTYSLVIVIPQLASEYNRQLNKRKRKTIQILSAPHLLIIVVGHLSNWTQTEPWPSSHLPSGLRPWSQLHSLYLHREWHNWYSFASCCIYDLFHPDFNGRHWVFGTNGCSLHMLVTAPSIYAYFFM